MPHPTFPGWLLQQEARALLSRLARLKPLVLQETMVPAATLSRAALLAIEAFLLEGRRELRAQARQFIAWLQADGGQAASPEEAQRRFVFLKLRFNAVLTQLDIFSEAMSQRSEAETGVWLAGLDAAATDALALPEVYDAPAVACYLARDAGGAIRRAKTRLPGGGRNPVAIIRLPRERMIGCGIASSLVHEVGHQAAHLLDLVHGLRGVLLPSRSDGAGERTLWRLWARWISEVVADLWAVGRVGVSSTLGLMSLVSLPHAFVFRLSLVDAHPTPWIRVKLSCALGDALYPHPQWRRLASVWESYYPLRDLPEPRLRLLRALEASIPRFMDRLLDFRPRKLGDRSLADLLASPERTPARLGALWASARPGGVALARCRPTVALGALGQARADGRVSPEEESAVLAVLLKRWAVEATLHDDRGMPAVRMETRPRMHAFA